MKSLGAKFSDTQILKLKDVVKQSGCITPPYWTVCFFPSRDDPDEPLTSSDRKTVALQARQATS